jgi:2-methylisocitrate lyase-like PEP mutase family enzyme
MLRTLGAHDVLSALALEQAGHEMVFVGGFGVAASMLGLPDIGLLTLSEMVDTVRRMALRLSIPIVADADTGHGDLQNVVRTVRELEQAGAAGILLEDQVTPKRCGHFAGKQLIPAAEMVTKLKMALDARRDQDFVLIARTDARGVEGFDAAVERANRYAEAGADMCFVEAPQCREELEQLPGLVPKPQLVNMLTGGLTPILPAEELERLGYKIMVCPVASLLMMVAGMRRLTDTLAAQGRVDGLQDQMIQFAALKRMLGLDAILNYFDEQQQAKSS